MSDVPVTAVTVPAAPSLKATVLTPAESKPNPLMMTVAAPADRLLLLVVTTGVTVAICTAALLRRRS